jgi:SAM domain (Sterile alpha motif)
MDVGEWLRSLGLSRYEEAFRDVEVGPDVLPDLTDNELEKLGCPLGGSQTAPQSDCKFWSGTDGG